MTDTTCKRAACDTISPYIAGWPTFCSPDCETIHNAVVHSEPEPADFSWLGPPIPRRGDRTGGWPG